MLKISDIDTINVFEKDNYYSYQVKKMQKKEKCCDFGATLHIHTDKKSPP